MQHNRQGAFEHAPHDPVRAHVHHHAHRLPQVLALDHAVVDQHAELLSEQGPVELAACGEHQDRVHRGVQCLRRADPHAPRQRHVHRVPRRAAGLREERQGRGPRSFVADAKYWRAATMSRWCGSCAVQSVLGG